MTTETWNWLPDTALTGPVASEAIDTALSAWSHRWFASFELQRQRLEPVGPVSDAAHRRSRLCVHMAPKDVVTLAGHAADLNLALLELTDDDREIIDAMGRSLLDDLADTLSSALHGFEPSPQDDDSGHMHLQVGDAAGRKLAIISVPRSMLAAARRRALPARRNTGRTHLTTYRSAASSSEVTLSACLGRATLDLADARRLAVGDVIILDKQLDDPLDLILKETGDVAACASLMDTASPRSLKIQARPGRDH